MTNASPSPLDRVIEAVSAKKKYRQVHPALIRSLAASELAKGRSEKEAAHAVAGKLHQVGSAYFPGQPDYAHLAHDLAGLPHDPGDTALKDFCLSAMKAHRSTRERLPILDQFFNQTLASIAPVTSVLDLACGFNPLAIPWMPLAPGAAYHGCDIYLDMVAFLNTFLQHLGNPGGFSACDLQDAMPDSPVQLALLLKTLPCLEQLERSISQDLLAAIPAKIVLVSYPVRSLGGRSKGMPETYSRQFNQLCAGRGWQVERFDFSSELAFLIRKS